MGVTQKKQAVIYCHPCGRFAVVETSRRDTSGSIVRIRESVMTPQRDKRGLCSDLLTDAERERWPSSAENAAPMPEGRHYIKLTAEEQERICQLFRAGRTACQIANIVGQSVKSIQGYLIKAGLRKPRSRGRLSKTEKGSAHNAQT